MPCNWIGWIIGIHGIAFGVWREFSARRRRETVHMALVALEPAIRGDNRQDVPNAINDMLERLKE